MARGRRSPLFIGVVVGLLLLVLIGLLAAIGLQLFSFANRIESRDAALMSAMRDNTETIDHLKQNLQLLANDSNTARRALKLPVREYPILRPDTPIRPSSVDDQDRFLSGLDTLLQEHDQRLIERRFSELADSPSLRHIASSQGLVVEAGADNTIHLNENGRVYFTLSVDPVSRSIRITDVLGKQLLSKELDTRASSFIQDRMQPLRRHFRELDAALETLRTVAERPEIASGLAKEGLSPSKISSSGNEYTFHLDRGETPVLTVRLDSKTLAVTAGDHHYRSVDTFASQLPGLLNGLGLEAIAEKRVEAARKAIENLQNDKTFMLSLSSRKIHFSRTPRQDIDYFYYDFSDAEGNRIGSFAVQKKLGTIYLMDAEDVPITALKTVPANPEAPAKKKLPLSSGRTQAAADSAQEPAAPEGAPQSLDILLCGAHQKETDTIVIAHAERQSGKVVLISIPRDLYYKGRKINAVYERFGPEELTKEVADITGLPIRKYVIIDMYAFIDVINILGGIDLNLKSPLVDPTYRVRTADGWGTLSYAAGTHHLDGIAALRIARSRHTTSDFARAYRQQDMLVAIRDKISRKGGLDVAQLYSLVGVVERYVDTNLSPAEVVESFLTFRNAPISGHYVIDTANVLYQTYANIYYLGDSGKHLPDSFDKGAWIVLPKNDDWSMIRQYVGSIIGGEAP